MKSLAKRPSGGGGLGVHDMMKTRATDDWNMGVKKHQDYPKNNKMAGGGAKRDATAPTPDTLGPRKA